MSKEIGLPFFTCTRELALIVDAMRLGVKSSIVWIHAGQRWQHEGLACGIPIDALIDIIAVNLRPAHFSALIHVFRNRRAGWVEVVGEADNGSGVCIPKWPLQVQVTVG